MFQRENILTTKLFKDEKGSVLPLISVIIIIFILVGTYEIGTIFVYRDRAIVRDAIDSACTSALAANTQEKLSSTKYFEVYVVEYDELGNATGGYWDARESNKKNYIYLNEVNAKKTATDYFNKIISRTGIKATLKDWNLSRTYDGDRILNVTQNRSNTTIAPSWWQDDFGDSDPSPWTPVSSNEQKSVRYPRWVKVTIEATITVPIPMGGVFGKTTQDFTWKSEAIKELQPITD